MWKLAYMLVSDSMVKSFLQHIPNVGVKMTESICGFSAFLFILWTVALGLVGLILYRESCKGEGRDDIHR